MRVDEILLEIRGDRRRGSTALAERALDALARSRAAAKELLAIRPSMPIIARVVRFARRRGVPAARRLLRASQMRLLDRAREILPPGARYRIYGGSGTLERVLRAVRARRVGEFPCDVALVGADALYPGGDFVNARGTSDFVRQARLSGSGVFAVASELKRVTREVPLEAGLERVDGKLVHAVLCERGLLYPPLPTLPGVEPTWMDRGALNPEGSHGRCHPHHPAVPRAPV
jgi:translation initiation factor 2B subunit (eIF-2B alpha/beta/delta family)